jgi:hypothetical protein
MAGGGLLHGSRRPGRPHAAPPHGRSAPLPNRTAQNDEDGTAEEADPGK